MKSLYEYLRQWISCWRTTSFPSANKSSRLYSIRSYSVIQWTGTCRSRIVWLTTMHKTTSMIRGTQYKGKKVVHDTTNLLGITELKKTKTTTTIIFTLFNDFDILILWLFSPPKNPPWYYPRCHQRWFTISPTFLERYAHSPAISDCKLWL